MFRGAYELLDLDEKLGSDCRASGRGASIICAVRNGQSVDASMGMTPLEG